MELWMFGSLIAGILTAAVMGILTLLAVSGQRKETRELSRRLSDVNEQVSRMQGRLAAQHEASDRMLRAEEERMERFRMQTDRRAAQMGEQVENQLQRIDHRMADISKQTEAQREALDRRLQLIQRDSAEKLDKMRETVDEKLQKTLDERLSQSFAQVSQRLEAVYRGLGEMQTLAAGVGDLKRVLTNVKNRGTWGEVQLEALLSQMLSPAQFEKNARIKKNSAERVDFAVKMPGQDGTGVLLPIDAKFPQEDYQRLLEAYDAGDVDSIAAAGKALAAAVRTQAKSIGEKYIDPPGTTDFAILYLPLEGLYAETLRQNGFVENLQNQYRVTVAGPTTLCALLTSLQMGFRSLAIEKRSGEVWQLLGAVKADFGRFAGLLDKTQRQLQTVTRSISEASGATRTITRRLREVEELPAGEAKEILGELPEAFEEENSGAEGLDD